MMATVVFFGTILEPTANFRNSTSRKFNIEVGDENDVVDFISKLENKIIPTR